MTEPPVDNGKSDEWVPEVWFLVTGRIAPELCCRNPGPAQMLFQQALFEVRTQKGDLDKAIEILQKILTFCPPEWMIFEQASQLLNVIGWRRTYHPDWFSRGVSAKKMQAGRCAPFIAHALALFHSGADEEALDLTAKIIKNAEPHSDDLKIARLMKASVLICNGEIDTAEDELVKIS